MYVCYAHTDTAATTHTIVLQFSRPIIYNIISWWNYRTYHIRYRGTLDGSDL